MPKCDFNKVAQQLCRVTTGGWFHSFVKLRILASGFIFRNDPRNPTFFPLKVLPMERSSESQS